jgi:hypothetical protein
VIRFSLSCQSDHAFDGWFRSSDDFDAQSRRGLVSCPVCGSAKVEKALMAPAVTTGRKKEKLAVAADAEQKRIAAALVELSRKMRENADYVGDKFAEEARKIHFGEADPRGIYGEATSDEAQALIEDGVEFLPLPALPEDRN